MITNLRITGPTPLPDSVRAALSQQVVSHRGDAFRARIDRILAKLRPLLGCALDPLLITTSGTGGLEATLINLIQRGQSVVAVAIGHFGYRFAELARLHGADVRLLEFPPGERADPDSLRDALERAHPVEAVLLTHIETSMGVINPLPELAALVRENSDALLLVDGVSSVGAVAIDMDRHGIDAVVTASQKALMSPPGLSVIGLSPRALARATALPARCDYFSFSKLHAAIAERTTAYTPAVGCIYGLDAALDLLHAEGFDNVIERHCHLASLCRAGLTRLGLDLLARDSPAPTLTASLVPGRASQIRERLEHRHATYVSQGRSTLQERLLRFGHMGHVNEDDITRLLVALAEVLAS